MTITRSFEKLKDDIHTFVAERDWAQFHSPKNLAMALSVEISEIVEIFQWLSAEQSTDKNAVDLTHLEEEIGDVMIYLTMLSEKFSIDPITAAQKKMQRNMGRYPASQYKGKAIIENK
jgi:NTP pyrophosphatase (non-canonical NTP hydrolase)